MQIGTINIDISNSDFNRAYAEVYITDTKTQLSKHYGSYSNSEELESAISTIWYNIEDYVEQCRED